MTNTVKMRMDVTDEYTTLGTVEVLVEDKDNLVDLRMTSAHDSLSVSLRLDVNEALDIIGMLTGAVKVALKNA